MQAIQSIKIILLFVNKHKENWQYIKAFITLQSKVNIMYVYCIIISETQQEMAGSIISLHAVLWLPSVLWRCWFGSRKGIRPVKNWVVGFWRGYLSGRVQICIWPSWCNCHSLSLAPINLVWFYLPGFTFLVQAHPGSPGQSPGSRKTVVVAVVVVP